MSVQKHRTDKISTAGGSKLKRGWDKVATTIGLAEDNFATFPSNFTAASLEDMWWELHSRHFHSAIFTDQRLNQYKECVDDLIDCSGKFNESLEQEKKLLKKGYRVFNDEGYKALVEEDVIPAFYKPIKRKDPNKRKASVMEKAKKVAKAAPGKMKKVAEETEEKLDKLKHHIQRPYMGTFSRIRHVKYNLRSMPPTNFSDLVLQKNATYSQNLSEFNVQKDDCLKNHLYIEALMYFEPLIHGATILDEETGQQIPLEHKLEQLVEKYGPTTFLSESARSNYYKEIVSAMEGMIKGFERLNINSKHSGPGPKPELFAYWYLSHLANIEKSKVVLTYKQNGTANSLIPEYAKNALRRWPTSRCQELQQSHQLGRVIFNTSDLEDNPVVVVHNVHNKSHLIDMLRNHIKDVPRALLEQYKDDLEVFTHDHMSIRRIWYHPNELAEDANTWNTENMGSLQIYSKKGMVSALKNLLQRQSTANRADNADRAIRHKTPANIALQLCMYVMKHPYFINTCQRFPQANPLTFKWIAKVICLWDMKICSSFVEMVEGGMTVYDWPAWALIQLKNFKNTHSSEKQNALIYQNPLFDKEEVDDMAKLLKTEGVDEILERDLFLPALNQPTFDQNQGRKKQRLN